MMEQKRKTLDKMTNSFLVNYYSPMFLENLVDGAIVHKTKKEFLETYDPFSKPSGEIYGFTNGIGEVHLAPKFEEHTLIHEDLHALSSSYVRLEDGTIRKSQNGINIDRLTREDMTSIKNEGLTELFAMIVSKDTSTSPYRVELAYYALLQEFIGNNFIGTLSNKYKSNNQLLFRSYISNNDYFERLLVDTFSTYKYKAGNKTTVVDFDFLSKNFAYFREEQLIELVNNISSNYKKYLVRRKLFKGKNIFDFDYEYEMFVFGLIRKAYYDLLYVGNSIDQVKIALGMLVMNKDSRYITNFSGVRDLLNKEVLSKDISLIDIVNKHKDKLRDIGINEIIGISYK